jgi:hypothetical protein
MDGLKHTLEVQATFDPKAANAKAEDFVNLRFVNKLKKSGFIDWLYNSGKHESIDVYRTEKGSKESRSQDRSCAWRFALCH